MTFNPLENYPDFYYNQAIHHLSQYPLWTVSDNNKRPMDMVAYATSGKLIGATSRDAQCLITLPQLIDLLPNHANCAFYVNTTITPYWVLDIEKTCPPEIRDKLLSIPALFRETSMSGKGYHLLLPAPANLHLYPTAARKSVLRHPRGYYEVLQAHFVTFTRNVIPEPTGPALTTWEDIYADLATHAQATTIHTGATSATRPEIDEGLQETIFERFQLYPYKKTLARDFENDNSRFEFGFLAYHAHQLLSMQAHPVSSHPANPQALIDLSTDAAAWLLYEHITSTIAPRPKHEQYRNGLPLLLNAAYHALASAQKSSSSARSQQSQKLAGVFNLH